ncbi:hypothetical protein E4U43_004488 [Claviceps pusilla]|uniref:Phosphoadenosine phosphosulphate reductase domain-containing protein n=1 Tax=Claviceps pusilla TaxID=123648 RepID=A0A9P7N5V1_9HYPO|nr:hypothetical protein E4U43_004488 [Claviceps pusilla]
MAWGEITFPAHSRGSFVVFPDSKIQDENPESKPVELIFLDTLYHFKETYELVDRVKARYPNVPVNIFRPDGMESTEQFEETYGQGPFERLFPRLQQCSCGHAALCFSPTAENRKLPTQQHGVPC